MTPFNEMALHGNEKKRDRPVSFLFFNSKYNKARLMKERVKMKFKIIAHRRMSTLASENTLSAFELI